MCTGGLSNAVVSLFLWAVVSLEVDTESHRQTDRQAHVL